MANKRRSTPARRSGTNSRRWRRFGTIAAAIVQLSLLVAAQTDITRRPAEQIRGSKAMWRLATLVNFVGPASYFTFGVKRRPGAKPSQLHRPSVIYWR